MKTFLLLLALVTMADDAGAADRRAKRPIPVLAPPTREEATGPHPTSPARWQGEMLIAIAGLFAAAALVGPLYRASHPEDPATVHAHDEPPGASEMYGPSGTLEPIPFDHRRV